MNTATRNPPANLLSTGPPPVDTSRPQLTSTFESPQLESRLNGEAEAEREDRAKRALLDALGRPAECD